MVLSDGKHIVHDSYMCATVLERPSEQLKAKKLPIHVAGAGELLLKVQVCGICRTDLHVVGGELREPASL